MKKDNGKTPKSPFYSKFEKDKPAIATPKGQSKTDKKPYGRKSEFGDKPDFRDKKPYGDGDKKPYERKPSFGDKPNFRDKKPYGDANKKPYGKKSEFGDKPDFRDKKPYGDGDKKPYERKPSFGDKPDFRDKKPYGDADKKPYGRKSEFGDKPDFRDRKPYSDADKKPYGRKSDFGDKPDFRDKKPYGDADKKPYGRKSDFDDRKRDFEKPNRPPKAPRSSEGRRVGDAEPPTYNFKRAEERIKRPRMQTDKPAVKEMRLNKYIANAGLCSRREADGLIETGQITVNGKVITEMGYKVNPTDVVKYGNRVLNPEKMVYILVNKPKDYITTTDDPEGRHTVMELIAGACQERVYPVGRLDRNTTGLLLLTNDGELAEKLMHPSYEIQKIYQVELDKPLQQTDFDKIKEGFELEDGFIKSDELAIVTPDAMVIGIEIHSGRNRIVRRIFEHLGYEVLKLDRTMYAGLTKKDLPRGKWRFLNEKEVIKLKYLL